MTVWRRCWIGLSLVLMGGSIDASAQETILVSRTPKGRSGNWSSGSGSISGDGRWVVFLSRATDLQDAEQEFESTPSRPYLFSLWKRQSWRLAPVALETTSFATITDNGRYVALGSHATNWVEGDENDRLDIFLLDRWTRHIELANRAWNGEQAKGNSGYARPYASEDGSFVVFSSGADNLVEGDREGIDPFVRDLSRGTIESVALGESGGLGDDDARLSSAKYITPDARLVAFYSEATNLVAGDTNGVSDVFVRDRWLGTTVRVSVSSTGEQGNGRSVHGSPSANGRFVAFTSEASNLVLGDHNGLQDVFVHDLWTRETTRVSVDSLGREGNNASWFPSISATGRFVVFNSRASNLVPERSNNWRNAFIHDRRYGTTTLLSVALEGGRSGSDNSSVDSLSADGRYVAFSSLAGDLVPLDDNLKNDAFVRDRWAKATWSRYGSGWPGSTGEPAITLQSRPVLGTSLRLELTSSREASSPAILWVGPLRADKASPWEGPILVETKKAYNLVLPPGGLDLEIDLPVDKATSGLTVYAQLLVLDPGASRGVAFSSGVEIVMGDR